MAPSPVTGVKPELSTSGDKTTTAVVRWTNSSSKWSHVRVTCNPECSPSLGDLKDDSVTINNLTPGETYTFTVTVYSNSVPSTPETSPPLTMVPSDPQPPIRAYPKGDNILLEWGYDQKHVVDEFRLRCSPSIGPCGTGNSLVQITNSSARTHTLSGANRGVVYAISIQAFEKSDRKSNWVDFNPVELGLEAPTNLIITERNNTVITLKWDEAPTDALIDEYIVFYTDSDMVERNKTIADNQTVTTSIDNLVPGHGYMFTLVSVASTGNMSAPSNPVEYTVAPTNPQSLAVDPPGSRSVKFTWNLGEGRRDGFETILYKPDGTNITDTIPGDLTFKEYKSLTPDTKYEFEIRSRSADLETSGGFKYSDWLNENVITDEDNPTAVEGLAVTETNSENITLSWSKPREENGVVIAYVIQTILDYNDSCVSYGIVFCGDCPRRDHNYSVEFIKKANECSSTLNPIEKPSTEFSSILFTVPFLTPFTDYTFKVWAFNTKEPSMDTVSNRTDETRPDAPIVTVVSKTHNSIYITWSDVSSVGTGVIEEYRVKIKRKDEDARTVTTVQPDDPLMYNITDNIKPYTEYTIIVQAKTAAGYGDPNDKKERTNQYLPDEPASMTLKPGIQVTNDKKTSYVTVEWTVPGIPNGVITGYRIQWEPVSGTSSASNIKFKIVTTADRSAEIFDGISHNTEYIVSVQARSEYMADSESGWGKKVTNTTTTLTSSPGPPPPVAPDVQESLVKKTTSDQVEFDLPSDVTILFPLDGGDIVRYQVLVIGQSSNQDVRKDELGNTAPKVLTWAEAKKRNFDTAYAIGAPKDSPTEWKQSKSRRKRAASATSITVGGDKSCKDGDTTYCNGPLKPNQPYCIYVRGFTAGGYGDSDCIVTPKTKQNWTPVIVGVVVPLAILIAIGAVIYVLRERRMGGKWPFKGREKLSEGPETPPDTPPTGTQVVRPGTPPPQAIRQEEFIEHTNNMHRDQDFRFSQEYQKVRDLSAKHTHNAAVSGPNTSKNRWVDILPFDHSRVKLLPADEEEGSDYINANYMPGYSSKREYIATQGPLPGTIDHFWRMVWEQNVTMIVMLTQLVERGRRKCEQYWPDTLEEPAAYGDLVVTKRAESVLPEYTIRIFDIQMGEITRSVKQFFVSFWPDFGCPERTESLLNLVRVVRSHMKPESRGPLVVHCSAGVGRTGTYVAVDRLLQHIQDHDELDVFNLVLEMRNYRCRMVQTEDQYIYIHDCIKEALLTNMSKRFTPPPPTDEDAPIYENAAMQSPQPGVDTEMVSLSMDGTAGGNSSGPVKNTEL